LFRKGKDVEIRICNTSMGDPQRKGWFFWSVFIETDPKDFANQILNVVYYLHPSFPQPRISIETGPKFELKASGWGEFTIDLEIFLDDKRRKKLSHYLRLTSRNRLDEIVSNTIYNLSKKDFK
jgi:transcription initiation factor IIF auxiliary subunit